MPAAIRQDKSSQPGQQGQPDRAKRGQIEPARAPRPRSLGACAGKLERPSSNFVIDYKIAFPFFCNKNNEIDFEIKKDLYDNIKLIGTDDDNLKKDLIDKKMSLNLFKIKNDSFKIINKDVPSLFKIPVKLPENSPAGEYFISMSLMDGGNKFETKKTKLTVKKPGVSSFIFSFAHKFSFIYGVFSAIIAIALGVFASFVFRKR